MSRYRRLFAKHIQVAAFIALLSAMALAPASAMAAPLPLFANFCERGGAAGQCNTNTGMAVDPSTGDVYVVDSTRIDKFSPWGGFIRAWGGGVASGGAQGTADVTAGSKVLRSVATLGKTFFPDQLITGPGIRPKTLITDVGVGTITLSKAATAPGSDVAISALEGPGNVPTNERQVVTIGGAPGGGSFTLTFTTAHVEGQVASNRLTGTTNVKGSVHVGDLSTNGQTVTAIDTTVGSVTFSGNLSGSGFGGVNTFETTTPISYNASAAEVQSALEALPGLGVGAVSVTGAPSGPYIVEFKGPLLEDTNVFPLSASGASLTPAGTVSVGTVTEGASAAESCLASGCVPGMPGTRAGQFGQEGRIATDSAGNVYVADRGNRRVQKFDPEGNFLLMFGGEVDKGPNHPGDICTAAYLADDECGAGAAGTGNGEFGEEWRAAIAIGPGDQVYVGDDQRIQKFDTAGNYTGQLPLPEAGIVGALATASTTGDLYFSYNSPAIRVSESGTVVERAKQPNVYRLDEGSGSVIGEPLKVMIPKNIAVDASGNVYVSDDVSSGGNNGPLDHPARILKFTSGGGEPEKLFERELQYAGALATSSACGITGSVLYAAGVGGSVVSAFGSPPNPAVCPPPSVPPSIAGQYVTAVDTTGATVKAEISPEFWPDTTYYVEYGIGKCSEGGCDKAQPASPGSKLTSQTTNEVLTSAGVFLGGLEPGTTYHYRLVAQSSGGGPVRGVGGEMGSDGEEGTFVTFPLGFSSREDCPNQAFRTAASTKLPDCRAYEMVSPVDKNGGDVSIGEVANSFAAPRRTSPDGGRFTFSSLASFANAPAAPLVNQYLSTRTSYGWSTGSISMPRGTFPLWPVAFTGPFKSFSEDLCSAWVLQTSNVGLTPEAPPGVAGVYRRDNCGEDQGYELLTNATPKGFGPGEISPEYYVPMPAGFSADEAHTVLRADAALTSNACKTPGIFQVYVTSKEGPMRLVSMQPDGTVSCTQSSPGVAQQTVDNVRAWSVSHAISADGSRVFWTDTGQSATLMANGFAGQDSGKLYVRLNATQPPGKAGSGCSEPERACTLPIYTAGKAFFWGANAEGTKAIYAAQVPGDNSERDNSELYEYDVAEAKSTLIAQGVYTDGVAGISEDASRVYFVTSEALTAAPNSQGDTAQAGKRNLYLYESADGGTSTFIGTLAEEDRGVGSSQPGGRSSRLTPDGMHLAFEASTSLTGYDNRDLGKGVPASELYVYDAEADGPGKLRCVSCNPSGARPAGRLSTSGGVIPRSSSATLPGWPDHLRASRLLTEDGDRLFFQSVDSLLPADSNGAQDVYEWQRADGPEACEESGAQLYVSSAEGCISLISSGQSPEDSEVLEASKGAADIFFITRSSLLPQDPGLYDVYDARAGGGFPPIPGIPPACEGEACQGAPAPPNDPTPASSAFEGAGNVAGKKKAKKHKKKVHKKKHAKRHAAKQHANKTRRASR